MKIEFYEEFPDKKNLEKLKLVKFKTKLFIAAKSLNDFIKYEGVARSYKKDLEVAYWPVVKNSYYVSPFSNSKDLIELFKELNRIKNPLLIDIELPIPRKLILTNFFKIRKNKTLIRKFIEENGERITVPQQPFAILSEFGEFIGLTYKGNYEKNPMFYTSMQPGWINSLVRREMKDYKDKENYAIGLGVTAVGVLGNEPIISKKNLEKDLIFIKEKGFEKAIIFRLGGLDKGCTKILEKFVK